MKFRFIQEGNMTSWKGKSGKEVYAGDLDTFRWMLFGAWSSGIFLTIVILCFQIWFTLKTNRKRKASILTTGNTVSEQDPQSKESEQIVLQSDESSEDLFTTPTNLANGSLMEENESVSSLIINEEEARASEFEGEVIGPSHQNEDSFDLKKEFSNVEERLEKNDDKIESVISNLKNTKEEIEVIQKELADLRSLIDNEKNQITAVINDEVVKAVKEKELSYLKSQSLQKGVFLEGKEAAILHELQSVGATINKIKREAESIALAGKMEKLKELKAQASLVNLCPKTHPYYLSRSKTISAALPVTKHARIIQSSQNLAS